MGISKNGWFILCHGNSHLEMDDDWGYPHFKKPLYGGRNRSQMFGFSVVYDVVPCVTHICCFLLKLMLKHWWKHDGRRLITGNTAAVSD